MDKISLKSVKIALIGLGLLLALSQPLVVQANEAQMKETLVKIINQLQAIKPLIAQAQAEQPPNPRIKIQFDRFRRPDGQLQNGLRQDIEVIQQALINAVNRESIEPRVFTSLENDFVNYMGNHYV